MAIHYHVAEGWPKGSKTRSDRTVISTERVKLARGVAPAEVIALESADDPEGFSLWLALAEGPAFVDSGPKKTQNTDALWSLAGSTHETHRNASSSEKNNKARLPKIRNQVWILFYLKSFKNFRLRAIMHATLGAL
jgi:hypothetical protein